MVYYKCTTPVILIVNEMNQQVRESWCWYFYWVRQNRAISKPRPKPGIQFLVFKSLSPLPRIRYELRFFLLFFRIWKFCWIFCRKGDDNFWHYVRKNCQETLKMAFCYHSFDHISAFTGLISLNFKLHLTFFIAFRTLLFPPLFQFWLIGA